MGGNERQCCFSWENLYDEELKNFNEFGDEGEIW